MHIKQLRLLYLDGKSLKCYNHFENLFYNSLWLSIHLPYDPEFILLGTFSRRNENICLQIRLARMFKTDLFKIFSRRKLPKCPLTGEWMNKSCHVYSLECCVWCVAESALTPAEWVMSTISCSEQSCKVSVDSCPWFLFMESVYFIFGFPFFLRPSSFPSILSFPNNDTFSLWAQSRTDFLVVFATNTVLG